jgi:predicted ATPase
VTLTGAGSGKTRLAIGVMQEVLDDFPDAVLLVLLAPLTDASAVCLALPRHIHLVLDNFEHVRAVAVAVGELLRGCHLLKVRVTSRPGKSRRRRDAACAEWSSDASARDLDRRIRREWTTADRV